MWPPVGLNVGCDKQHSLPYEVDVIKESGRKERKCIIYIEWYTFAHSRIDY
jgi:hypothetical protein